MKEAIFLAILAAFSFGSWTVFEKLGSTYVNKVFGAILVSLTAVVLGSIIILPKLQSVTLFTSNKGIIFIILAGVCAFFIDFLALSAYGKGLPVSIGGPLIIGGSMAIAVIVGLIVLGEQLTLLKLVGVLLVICGAVILAYYE